MSEEIKKILSNMLHIIIKYSDDFDELEENEIRYQLPYKQMEKLYDHITSLQQKVEQLEKENKRLKEWKEDLLSENIELENIRKEAKRKINNMFDNGDETRIIDDLLELTRLISLTPLTLY